MSQGPYQNQMPPAGPPPKSGGGMSTVLIVLLVLGVLGLICCGICGSLTFWGAKAGGEALVEPAMQKIRGNQEVVDALGEPLTANFPSAFTAENANSTVDFEVSGSKGKGKAHAELTSGPNGLEPKVITVTLPDGKVINVPVAEDPTNLNFDAGLEEGIQMDEDAAPATPPATEGEDATE